VTVFRRAARRLWAFLRDARVWHALAVLAVLAVLLLVVAIANDAFARPGGGQGYSGGSGPPSGGSSPGSSGGSSSPGGSSSSSSPSSGSSGGGLGEALVELLVVVLIELVVREPRIGIPVLLCIVLIILGVRAWGSLGDWISKR